MHASNLKSSEINTINSSQNNSITKPCTLSHILGNTVAVTHSNTGLKQGERHETSPPVSAIQKITNEVELIEKKITDTGALNAKDYVYLGSSEMTSFSDMGMTLDQEGQLLLIKGSTRDLISGIYHKYRSMREYTGYTVKERGLSDKKTFTSLYIDNHGRVVGKNSSDNSYYEIMIEKNQKIYSPRERTESIKISYKHVEDANFDSLSFVDKENNTLTFACINGRLSLSTYSNNVSKYNCDICEKDFRMPFGSEIKILSAKRTRTHLQIETFHDNKKRIFYIDPKDISVRGMKIHKASHKPPQNFVCNLGRSPYENYESGQPFSSTRRGNFNSRWIILFSPIVDNYRLNFQESKTAHSRGEHAKSIVKFLCAIDPGARALTKVVVKNFQGLRNHIQDKDKTNLITNMAKTHSSLIAKLPDSASKEKNFTEALTEFMAKMPEKDYLSFDDISKITLFAGMAQGGLPFRPGFFFGLVASLSRTHNITLAKKGNGDICFSFKNTTHLSLTALAGTGQGSEEILFKAGSMDLLSLLPYEANVILTGSVENEKSTLFDIKPVDMNEFLTKSKKSTELKKLINEKEEDVIVKQVTKYGGRLFLEVRAPELRPQIGHAFGKNYAVTPRVTAGVMTTLGIGTISHTKSKETSLKSQQTRALPSITDVEGISLDTKIVTEQKIMPITYTNIHCHDFYEPLPVVEHVQSHNAIEILAPQIQKKNSIKVPDKPGIYEENHEHANKIDKIIKKIDQPKIKQNTIDKLTDIKVIYETKRHHIWRKKTGKYIKDVNVESAFRSDLTKIKKELQNKKRKNLGKELSHSFLATFQLSPVDQEKLDKFKEKFAMLKENQGNLNIGDQKIALADLYRNISQFNVECKHRITAIELYSIGNLSDTLSTIFSGVISLVDIQKITYQQHLGDLLFEYHDNKLFPDIVQANYKFIEKDKHSA